MACRRFTRLTNAFSKKLENLKAAMAEEPKAKPKMADKNECPYCLSKAFNLEVRAEDEGRYRRLSTTSSNQDTTGSHDNDAGAGNGAKIGRLSWT